MPLGQSCLGSWSLKFPTGAGEGVQRGTQCCPPSPTGGIVPPIWDTDRGSSNQIALFPPLTHDTPHHPHPLGFPGPPVAIHQQREFSGKRGRVRDPLLGIHFRRMLAKLPVEEDRGRGGGDGGMGVDVGPPFPLLVHTFRRQSALL